MLETHSLLRQGGVSLRMVLARMKCANKNLMRPDLLSEILLLGSAAALFGSILLIVVVAMSRA